MDKSCAVILAAGEGKRMKSDLPKVMLNVLFKPMLQWVIDSVHSAGTDDICVVVGFKEEVIRAYLGDSCEIATQSERKGTGHAVMMAKEYLSARSGGHVLVLCGDAPFMDDQTIKAAYNKHVAEDNSATVISAVLDDPTGYGRIIRDGKIGPVLEIVEHKDATPEQLVINEINSGAYWFKIDDLLPVLDTDHITNNNAQGEYYLPDVIKIFLKNNLKVNAYISDNKQTVMGANNCVQLNNLSGIARKNILNRLLENGVEMPSSAGVIIGPDVEIGRNVTILPGTILRGKTFIDDGCTIGPNSLVDTCTIGKNTIINASQCYYSTIGSNTDIGPFSHVRPGCSIDDKVHMGDFVELKNTRIGSGTKISHLCYIGDSELGEDVNVGCGFVTVNYDGKNKHSCHIGNGAFLGCNSSLIAPITVGNDAYVAAGTTITEDVPDGALAIGRVRQETKEDWNKKQ